MTDLPRPIADDASDRRANDRVVEIDMGQPQTGAGLLPFCFFFVALRAQHAQRAQRGGDRRALLRQRRRRFLVVRLSRLKSLAAGIIACRQLFVALVIALGAGFFGFRRGYLRLGLVDHRALQVEPAVVGIDRGLFGRHRRLGLRRLRGEIAVVDDEQHVAHCHGLVVLDPDFLDVTFDLRADQRDVALDVGIIGGLQKAPLGPPIPPPAGGKRQQGQGKEDQKRFAHGWRRGRAN